MQQSGYTPRSKVKFAVNIGITGAGFIPYAGVPLGVMLQSINMDGGFDKFYNGFSDK